jgi:intracellular multiplication protein IcmK
MAVFLEGLATPIMIKLTSGEPDRNAKVRYVDYRLDLRIPGRGPNAKAPLLGPGRIGMYNDALQGFLDGTPPSDAKTVRIEGEPPAHTVVWQMGDSLYLRTPLEIRSAFDQTMSSADGMHVYKLAPTPLVTVSEGGQDVSLMLDIE